MLPVKLIFVRMFLNRPYLEAAVEDADGKKRLIAFTFQARDAIFPPPSWLDTVIAEVQNQRANEKGGIRPGRRF